MENSTLFAIAFKNTCMYTMYVCMYIIAVVLQSGNISTKIVFSFSQLISFTHFGTINQRIKNIDTHAVEAILHCYLFIYSFFSFFFFQSDKVTPLWIELNLHIYRTATSRVGFDTSNIIISVGELPLNN